MLVGKWVEFRPRLGVEQLGSRAVTALGVQQCRRSLDYSLPKPFLRAAPTLPHFFPRLVTFEESTRVEKLDALFEAIFIRAAVHRHKA